MISIWRGSPFKDRDKRVGYRWRHEQSRARLVPAGRGRPRASTRLAPDAHYEWACFAAQQAAEKAAIAACVALGQRGQPSAVTPSLELLRSHAVNIDASLFDRARALDKHHLPTRYPKFFASGAPTDFYTRSEAERAIMDAVEILEVCRRMLSA